MRTRPGPLLAELHAHTTWSDGALSTAKLVDLYGRAGFDVLAVTDHVVRSDDPWPDDNKALSVDRARYGHYLAEIGREAARAMSMYGLLVVPGLELTYNDLDPTRAAHPYDRELFPWVAEAGLPAVACGDTHTPEHLYGWETLLPCSADEQEIVSYLRSKRPVYLTRVEADEQRLAA